mmetsp:Transcript_15397/g.15375  ORF Transcript_15397/g.15375 Transcript_15397/m.15375 type:complete len:490 (+) Transcript_15397:259-1728(+)
MAVAHRELSRFQEALDYAHRGLAINPEFPELLALKKEIEADIEIDTALPLDHPERKKFENLFNWLIEGGAKFPKIKLRFYSKDYRGVHSTTFIAKNECIVVIPRSHIITLEMAKATPIGQKMVAANLNLLSPKHSFLSSFILQEKAKEESWWKPYLDILPESYSNFPIFYTDEDKEWLTGSPFLEQVNEKIQDIEEDYNCIVDAVPEFANFPLFEFSKIRMGVSSRIFGMQIDGNKTDGFVPLADMLNHRRPRQTTWSYEESKNGFIIEAMEDIERGIEVLDSYGKKCNSRFLLNYGFIVRNNDANEYPFKCKLREDDPNLMTKRSLIDGNSSQTFRVQADEKENIFNEFLGFLRFLELNDISILPRIMEECQEEDQPGFKPSKVKPISLANERKVLQHVQKLAKSGIDLYPETLQEDAQILQREDLTENQRNCVLMRQGEKQILDWYFKFSDLALALLDMERKEVKKAAKGSPYESYLTHSIIPLLGK